MARENEENRTCGIYLITNLVNGKKYVGQSNNIEKRFRDHRNNALSDKTNEKNNQIIYRAMRKYGFDNFSFEILIECEEDLLDLMEIYYIKKYNTYIHWKGNWGYNMTLGGNTVKGLKMSNKARKKISEAFKNNPNRVNPNAKAVECENVIYKTIKDCAKYYNIPYITMRKWLDGANKIPKEWADKGLKYCGVDNYKYNIQTQNFKARKVVCDGLEFNCCVDVAKYLGMPRKTVNNYLIHKNKMPYDLYIRGLRYIDESINNYEVSNKCKPVICDGVFYKSNTECANYYNIDKTTINKWLTGKNKIPKNFEIRYADEYEIKNFYIEKYRKDDINAKVL